MKYINMNCRYYLLVVLIICGISSYTVRAQNVERFWGEFEERIAQKDWLNVTGSLQASLLFNRVSGLSARTDPFNARLSASLLIDILGFKGPFSLAVSDQSSVYSLPAYSFYGFSPTYKWIKLHIGDRSLNFSPYSLSGQSFRGFGMELSPGKWKVTLMQGVLNTSRIEDAGTIQGNNRQFDRRAKGLYIGRQYEKGEFGIGVFHVLDDFGEEVLNLPGASRPQNNLVLDFNGSQQLGERVNLDLAFAHSILTRDLNAPKFDNGSGFNGSMLGLVQVNSSTSYSQAFRLGSSYEFEAAKLRFDYERIDAGYKSLGTLSFLNDTEQLSLGGATGLFNNKVSLSGRAGIQRNGLSNRVLNNGVRVIADINLGLVLNERLTTSLSVSNFNYTQRQRISTVPFVVVDSVVIVQSNFNTQGSILYLLGEDKETSISLMGGWQQAVTANGDDFDEENASQFFMSSLVYSINRQEANINCSVGLTWNSTVSRDLRTSLLGSSLNFSWGLIPAKMNLRTILSMSFADVEDLAVSRVFQAGLSLDYALSKKQRITWRGNWVNNNSRNINGPSTSFSDVNLALNYSLSF